MAQGSITARFMEWPFALRTGTIDVLNLSKEHLSHTLKLLKYTYFNGFQKVIYVDTEGIKNLKITDFFYF